MKTVLLFATCLLVAPPALAGSLADLRSSIAGQEVEITGYIGTGLNMMDKEALSFRDESKTVYPVVFDAGRTARKQLEGCQFAMFSGGTPCAMSGKAEIELDGATLRLIIFDVSSIAAPAKLPD